MGPLPFFHDPHIHGGVAGGSNQRLGCVLRVGHFRRITAEPEHTKTHSHICDHLGWTQTESGPTFQQTCPNISDFCLRDFIFLTEVALRELKADLRGKAQTPSSGFWLAVEDDASSVAKGRTQRYLVNMGRAAEKLLKVPKLLRVSAVNVNFYSEGSFD